MTRRSFALLTSMLLAILAFPASASAAGGTQVVVRFTEVGGRAPMANANVGVFYMTPAQAGLPAGSKFRMVELASGTTNAQGLFSATLDTSGIARADLGDVGEGGANAFNAEIEAIDRQGNFAVASAVLIEGSGYSGAVRVDVPAPATAAQARSAPALSGDGVVLAHAFRYTPVTALNAGAGMQVVLKYTTSKETQRQTQVKEALINQTGGVSVGGYQLEEHSRQITSPLKKKGNYHRWVWANYRYNKIRICGSNCGGGTAVEWKPYEFTGQAITDYNPDKNKHHKTIKVVGYKQPPFTPGSNNQNWFILTRSNSGWTRASGTREGNSVNGMFILPFASNIGVSSLTVYGSITSVTYNWIRGCRRGDVRVVWGYKSTPADATQLQADCMPKPRL